MATDDSADREVGQSRWVLHVDMDAFFASCEQLTRPTLRGRPVLVGGAGGRGVVAGCSYEARAKGARSAMPMHQARRLVGPAAVVLPPRGAVYSTASRRVLELMRSLVPVVEQVSIDEAFLEPPDLRGRTPSDVRRWAEEFREAIRELTGLPASVGAGAGKQYAKIASGLAKPDGVHVIPRRDHPVALDPLPVRSLWGIGPVAESRLAQIGVSTIGELAALPDDEVERALGTAFGRSIVPVARGYDDSEVAERGEAKQISAESTFAADLRTAAEVAAAIRAAAGHAHRRLLRDGRAARTVTVKLKRADFHSITRSATLPRGTSRLETIVSTALPLAPDPLEFGAIRLVGVGLSGLVTETQGLLFGDDADDPDDPDDAADPAAEDAAVAEDAVEWVDSDDHEMAADAAGHADAAGPGAPGESGEPSGSAEPEMPGSRWSSPAGGLRWRAGADVTHPDFGHGWVQGSGHGRVSVRFETRSTGPGPMRTFSDEDPALTEADPVDSLDW